MNKLRNWGIKFGAVALVLIVSLFCYSGNPVAHAKMKFWKPCKREQVNNTITEVRASHILVRTEEEAEKLRKEIIVGKDFVEAAKEYSRCPSGQDGGDLGYFGRGQMVPAFEKAAFSLPVGEVSEPIKTQFGYHLIIVTDQK